MEAAEVDSEHQLAEPTTGYRPIQQRGRERRESIVIAAEELVDEHGPFSAELSVRAIAERAGSSVGTLYHYFPDLDSLIAAVAERFMDEVVAATTPTTSLVQMSWVDQLARSSAAFRSIFTRRPGLRELWFNPRAPSAVAEIHQRYHRMMAARSQQRFFELTGVKLDLTVHVVLMTMLGSLLELAFRDDPQGDERIFVEMRRVQIGYYQSHLSCARMTLDTAPFV